MGYYVKVGSYFFFFGYDSSIGNSFLWSIAKVGKFEVCPFSLVGSLLDSSFDLGVGVDLGAPLFMIWFNI